MLKVGLVCFLELSHERLEGLQYPSRPKMTKIRNPYLFPMFGPHERSRQPPVDLEALQHVRG